MACDHARVTQGLAALLKELHWAMELHLRQLVAGKSCLLIGCQGEWYAELCASAFMPQKVTTLSKK